MKVQTINKSMVNPTESKEYSVPKAKIGDIELLADMYLVYNLLKKLYKVLGKIFTRKRDGDVGNTEEGDLFVDVLLAAIIANRAKENPQIDVSKTRETLQNKLRDLSKKA